MHSRVFWNAESSTLQHSGQVGVVSIDAESDRFEILT